VKEKSVAFEQALATVWWILRELRDPGVLAIEREVFAHASGADAEYRARLLSLRIEAGWSLKELDCVARELCRLLEVKFRELAIPANVVLSDRVFKACARFVRQKYANESEARLLPFARTLTLIALERLPVRELPQAQAAFAVLNDLRKTMRPSKRELSKLDAWLDRRGLAKAEQVKHARDRLAAPDPVAQLLEQLFNIDPAPGNNGTGYWREFFDWRGRVRSKKLPPFRSMFQALVDALREPTKFGSPAYTEGFALSKADVCELAARCARTAFPEWFDRYFDGVALRGAIRDHREMHERLPEQRPRYRV